MTGPVDGVEVGFQTSVIDDGANAAAATGAAAAPVIDRLAGMVITAGQFGRVAPAEALASGLGAARDGFRDLALRIQQRHTDLASRARSTATAGAAGHRDQPGRHGWSAPVTATPACSTGTAS